MPCQSPHLDESTTAAPGVSPGIVADNEILLREVLNPDHVVNGELLSSAIPLKDLKGRGFSVHRREYVTQRFVESSIGQKLVRPFGKETRGAEEFALFSTRTVRKLQNDGLQAFVVIDTGMHSNPGHAPIYLSQIGMKESLARRLRNKLLTILENRVSVTHAFARL